MAPKETRSLPRSRAPRRPHDAIEHYSRSLEEGQERRNELQVLFDLLGLGNALATLGDDAAALEVVGLAETQIAEMGGREATGVEHLLGADEVLAAEQRVGHPAASDLRGLGRAVPAGGRVARACELGRARLLA
jgi:hypothetical protein